MREVQRLRTIHVRWRRAVTAVPAVLVAASGIALAADSPAHAPARPASATRGSASVPSPPGALLDPATYPGPDGTVAPALVLPDGSTSSGSFTLDAMGIPARALAGYHLAQDLLAQAAPSCHLDWSLVAAIGRVESAHGQFGGNQLNPAGQAVPGIYGIPLDGTNGTALIRDTDRGRLDHDTTYDRAVGPMQFIPGTWNVVGSDGNGDGVRDPQNIDDAATAAGVYLCAGRSDLSSEAGRYAAVLRYNNSDSYARTVLAIADGYAHGIDTFPISSLPAAHTASGQPVQQSPAPAGQAAGSAPGGQPAPAAGGGSPATSSGPGGSNGSPSAPATPPGSGSGGVLGGVVGGVGGLLGGGAPPAPPPAPPPVPAPPPAPVCVLDPILPNTVDLLQGPLGALKVTPCPNPLPTKTIL